MKIEEYVMKIEEYIDAHYVKEPEGRGVNSPSER
jgi:hypothetical protein